LQGLQSGLLLHTKKMNEPIASYWESWRALGSFFFKGSGKTDSSGT
jgi:hypothetical protein